MFSTVRHLFHVYRVMTTSSTSEGIIYDRMVFMCGVARHIVVCRCYKCCSNVVNVVKQHLHHLHHLITYCREGKNL